MFSNADRLATQIYAKATAQAGLRRSAEQLAAVNADSQSFANALASDLTGETHQLIRDSLTGLDNLNAMAFSAFGGGPQETSPATATSVTALPRSDFATMTSGVPGLMPVAIRLRKLSLAVNQATVARERLNRLEVEIVRLLKESGSLSQQLNDRIKSLMQSIQSDIAVQNKDLGAVLTQRTTVMLALGVLGLLLSVSIAIYFQLSVIGRLNRLRAAVQGRSPEVTNCSLREETKLQKWPAQLSTKSARSISGTSNLFSASRG